MSLWSRIERRIGEIAGELILDEYRDRLADARRLLGDGDARAAATLLERLLEERPDRESALTLLGAARLALGDPTAALDAFERARILEPQSPDVHLGCGEALLALDRVRDATASFRLAIDEAGGDRSVLAEAYRGLGLAYQRLGELDKAVRELRKAVAEAPDDALALAALGEAIAADRGRANDEARRHLLRAAERDGCPPQAWLALGRIALDDLDSERAAHAFSRARDAATAADTEPLLSGDRGSSASIRASALVGLGDAHRLAGNDDDAIVAYRQALDIDPRRADARARLAAVAAATDPAAALDDFDRAVELGAGLDVFRAALDAALRADAIDRAVPFASVVLESDPGDPRALVARARALAKAGEHDAAAATYAEALVRGPDLEAHLGLARLALDRDAGADDAARHALDALRCDPGDDRARELLGAARARSLGIAASDADYYQLAEGLRAVCAAVPELTDLAAPAAEAAADFDRPLLVTIMGEFSSGKSSFVNAFIGAEVAPTGITPTTATINVVKVGRERGGRIVYRDGRIEELGWEPLYAALRDLDDRKAREVAHVEIRLPLDELERVNIVDTPGLNSILPEHEEVARAFIARADAVVWLFTAQQAGKASEREALDKIRAEGVGVLAVLNKIDQLSDSERSEVLDHVQRELGDRIEDVVPLSARRALAGEDGSNWDALHAALESHFFARAREIKRRACDRRLGVLLGRAQRRMAERRRDRDEARGALRAAADAAADARLRFVDEVVARERRQLQSGVAELYRGAAREVLELVRPRRLPFGSHKATRADRDYLLGLLDGGYEALLDPSRERVGAELRATCADLLAGLGGHGSDGSDVAELSRSIDDGVRLVEAEVFARCRAYVAGYLRGGYIDHFFRADLPKLELSEDSVYRALYRGSPDLDAQIAVPLARAADRVLSDLGARLDRLADLAEVAAHEVDAGVGRALELLAERKRELAGS